MSEDYNEITYYLSTTYTGTEPPGEDMIVINSFQVGGAPIDLRYYTIVTSSEYNE